MDNGLWDHDAQLLTINSIQEVLTVVLLRIYIFWDVKLCLWL